MNRTDRLMAIVLYLQSRRLVRAEDLAENFAVSLRTIYRDIAALGEAGVPISAEAGVGYSLVKGYHLPPVSFTGEEAAALFVGGELVKRFADASLRGPAGSALLKIRSVLPADRQEEITRLERATVIASPGRPAPGLNGDVLRPIQQALVARRVLRMDYRARDRSEDTAREVEPMGVVFGGGAWYLVAWCRLRGAVRHFRLDRIRKLELGTERFATRGEFDLQRHLAEIEASSPRIEVRLRVTPPALERVRAESYCEVSDEKPDAGRVAVRLHTYSLEWCARWVLSFGAEAEALAPATLREKVRALAREALRNHD
ncbi:MAG TPA: YafY family protein [Opitutaceae bacterium]|nr:YafY family protein [Opitutaceae bacterium]